MPEHSSERLIELIHRANEGNRDAINELGLVAEKFLEAYYRKKLRNHRIVEDLIQDAYLRFHESLNQLKKPQNFRAFLAQIALNTMRDYFRRSSVREQVAAFSELQPGHEKEDEPLDFSDPDYSEEDYLRRVTVEQALTQLPELNQKIIWLKMEGCLNEEIAKQLGISLSMVKMRYLRSLEFLRKEIFS